ncbi:helix-turn-helix transcriptional regulator [Effusibacillus pohliae]|uniref:helix-turn-helix transcriptional regulator n=1 Tax=Effusibacillus pohliae TaxID=232270 RepID=UPI00035E14EC|nr:helix-turn-helix transcriptional regulator [Effusibacillus pohliae]
MRRWLVEYRGSKTQEEVATACGIHRGYYSLIESGDRTPSVPVAKRIAAYLGFEWTLFFEQNCVESTRTASTA